MPRTKLNAAAALNSQKNETALAEQGGELNQSELNQSELNQSGEQGGEQGTQGTPPSDTPPSDTPPSEQKGVKFTLNTPNPAFMNYLGTRSDEFVSEFEKFASEFDSSEFERPSNEKAGKAFDSLINLLISSEFSLKDENFSKYMAEKNPIADYTKPAIKNARDYARAQLENLCEFGNRAEKAYQNFNRANKEASKAELKSELQKEKDAAAVAQAQAAAAAAQNESKGA